MGVKFGSIVIGMQRRCIHNTNNASLIRLWNPGKYDRIAQVADIISANLNLNLPSEWHTDGPDIRRQEKSHLLFVTIRQLSHVWNYQAGNTNYCIWLDTLHYQCWTCCHHQSVFIIDLVPPPNIGQIHLHTAYNINRKTSNKYGHTLKVWQKKQTKKG